MHKREDREERGSDLREGEPLAEDGAEREKQALDAQEQESMVEDGDVYEGPDERCVLCRARETGPEREQPIQAVRRVPPEVPGAARADGNPDIPGAGLRRVFAVGLLSSPCADQLQNLSDRGRQMQAREYAFAYRNYTGLLEEYSGSVTVALKAADAALSAQYFPELSQTVDDYLSASR